MVLTGKDIKVIFIKSRGLFQFYEVKEVLLRIKDYLGDKLIDIKYWDDLFNLIYFKGNLDENSNIKGLLSQVRIKYSIK